MSMILTISQGLQITIPAEYRSELNLKVGSRIEMEKKGHNLIIKPIDADIKKVFEEARKGKRKKAMTAEEMDNLIENEILRH